MRCVQRVFSLAIVGHMAIVAVQNETIGLCCDAAYSVSHLVKRRGHVRSMFFCLGGNGDSNKVWTNGLDRRLSVYVGEGKGLEMRESTRLCMLPSSRSSREDEILRKIIKLKKEGKLGKNKKPRDDGAENPTFDENETEMLNTSGASAELRMLESLRRSRQEDGKSTKLTEEYEEKIRRKMDSLTVEGKTKSSKQDKSIRPLSRSQSVQKQGRQEEDEELVISTPEDDDDEEDLDDDDLVDIVAKKLAEKTRKKTIMEEQKRLDEINLSAEMEQKEKEINEMYGYNSQKERATKRNELADPQQKRATGESNSSTEDDVDKRTTGVGGSWSAPEKSVETYKPTRGSWGAFPRPKNISTAYGGGKRVGAGVTSKEEEQMSLRQSEERTRERLKAYRQKVGIEVQSEKDNADEIDEALALASRAMQRGVYGTAVSALEKVTRYCSANSKVGGKVFLELAMAYEAVGRTEEAITVYTALTKSRAEEIKFNAKRLLYGIEAINFMRNEAKDARFSRKKVSQEFIDATGMSNIADNFDKVYNTAYVDMDNPNFYKRLTESVVRSTREARLILLKAVNAGEVDRLRIVQALRSLSRDFDTALTAEEEERREEEEEARSSVALMNGMPIVKKRRNKSGKKIRQGALTNIDQFSLSAPRLMMENFDGEWRLQLVADKTGDGVKFFNTTIAWQKMDTSAMEYESCIPSGFLNVKQKGKMKFDEKSRTVEREQETPSSGGWLDFGVSFASKPGSSAPFQQIISVDSELCVTRMSGPEVSATGNVKEYFSVWRRVEPGTFSEKMPST